MLGGGVSGTEDTDDFNAASFSDAALMESLHFRERERTQWHALFPVI